MQFGRGRSLICLFSRKWKGPCTIERRSLAPIVGGVAGSLLPLDRGRLNGCASWAGAVRLMENVRRFVGKQRCVVRALVGAKPDVILVGKGARIESSRRLPVLWIGVDAHGSEIGAEHGLDAASDRLAQRTAVVR